MRTLVLSTIPAFGYNVTRCLAQAGHEVDLCEDAPDTPARRSRWVSRHLVATREELTQGPDTLINRLNAHIRNAGVQAVLATDTRPTRMLARIRGRLEAPCFPMDEPDRIDALNDKSRFAERLGELGLPHPATRRVESVDDLTQLDLSYPIIIKPIAGENSEGVVRIDTPEQAEAHVRAATEAGELPLLAQHFMPGYDIDFSFLADHGRVLAWTIQQKDHSDPAKMIFSQHPEVLELGTKVAEGTVYHGVAHIDLRVDERDGRVKFIEFNPRFWGSVCYSLWAGVNFPDLGLKLMRGEDVAGAFEPVYGECVNTGFTPRRLLKTLLTGRWTPAGMSEATQRAWRDNHADPLPHLFARRADKRRKSA